MSLISSTANFLVRLGAVSSHGSDIDEAPSLYVTESKDAATVAAFAEDLAAHGGDPDAVKAVCVA